MEIHGGKMNALAIQYDFFKTEEESELEALRKRVEEIDASSHRVRKGIYARHGELFKIINDLEDRLKIIERNLCKNE
jgi:hypothetical protein